MHLVPFVRYSQYGINWKVLLLCVKYLNGLDELEGMSLLSSTNSVF